MESSGAYTGYSETNSFGDAGNAQIFDAMLLDGLNDAFSDQHSGWHTEGLVSKYDISRDDQDALAARSQQCFS